MTAESKEDREKYKLIDKNNELMLNLTILNLENINRSMYKKY